MNESKWTSRSALLCNASMLLYICWLMLPAVQALGHAVAGVATVALFGVGVAMDGETLQHRLWSFLARVACAVLLPLVLFFCLERGGGNLPAYLVQQGMFWFPLLWCAYARERGDDRLYRFVWQTLLAAMTITTLTTIGWLIQGLLRGDGVYAYSRSLGSGEAGRANYLRELMLRNIGGYDFVYATVVSLPVTCWAIHRVKGAKRLGFAALYAAQLVMIVLSQYTYAIVFAAGVTAVEVLALMLRAMVKRMRYGASLLWTLPIFGVLWLLRVPLISWAQSIAASVGFANAAYSLDQLLTVVTGGAAEAGSRWDAYSIAWQGFASSPLFGALFGGARTADGARMLGLHSDLLDLLSGLGLVGTAAFAGGAWCIKRGAFNGFRRTDAGPALIFQALVLLCCMALGTVFYSREIPLVMAIGAAFLLRADSTAV